MCKNIAAILLLLFAASAQAEQGMVIDVIDGDTIKVISPKGLTTIRLYGIDAPEKKQAFGLAAKDFVETMIEGETVDITVTGEGGFGRTSAVVMFGTQCLQEQLILSGYAWVYWQYCKRPYCSAWSRLQGISAGNRVGLWSVPMPIQPWEWRKARR